MFLGVCLCDDDNDFTRLPDLLKWCGVCGGGLGVAQQGLIIDRYRGMVHHRGHEPTKRTI